MAESIGRQPIRAKKRGVRKYRPPAEKIGDNMAVGYYLIHDTCPDLYDKTIKRLVKQLKADKTPYTIAEISTKATHEQACNRINYKSVTLSGVRKVKACNTCPHMGIGKFARGRNVSDKLTIINITEGK